MLLREERNQHSTLLSNPMNLMLLTLSSSPISWPCSEATISPRMHHQRSALIWSCIGSFTYIYIYTMNNQIQFSFCLLYGYFSNRHGSTATERSSYTVTATASASSSSKCLFVSNHRDRLCLHCYRLLGNRFLSPH